jgi:hypothetical protein
VTEAFGRAFRILVDGIRTCQADGEFTPGPPEPLAITAWSTVHGLAVLAMEGLLPPALTFGGRGAELAEVVTRTLGAGLVLRAEPIPDA